MKAFLHSKNVSWHSWVLVAVLLSALLRLFQLGSVPVSLYMDEAAIGLDAKVIAETGRDMHGKTVFTTLFPSYGDYKLPVYVWFASISVKVFGPTEFAIRLPSALVGIAQTALIAHVVAALFNRTKEAKTIAIVAAFVLAVSPWSVLFSRTGFEGHVGQFFITVSMFALLKAKKDPRWYVLAIAAGGLAVYSYFSVRFVLPVVWLAALWLGKVWQKKAQLVFGLGSLLLWALFFIPMIRSPYYAPSNQYRLSAQNILTDASLRERVSVLRERESNGVLSRVFYRYTFEVGKAIAQNYGRHMDLRFLFLHGDANLRHGTGRSGLFLVVFLPFFLAGWIFLWRNDPAQSTVLFLWWMIALLPASIPQETPHALRSLNALTPLSIVIAYGVGKVLARLRHFKVFQMTVLLLMMLNAFFFFQDYFLEYPKRSARAWDDGAKQLATAVWKRIQDQPTIERAYVAAGNKFFLWGLFFGPYDGKTIQTFPEQGYHKTELGPIRDESYWDTIRARETSPSFILVGQQLSAYPSGVTPSELVRDTFGAPLFGVSEIRR